MARGRRGAHDLGRQALQSWRLGERDLQPFALAAAVRFTLAELEKRIPGQSVEIRVPPAGAIQVLGGTQHRRGTPPALIEMGMATWLDLVVGRLTWQEVETEGLMDASGQRADLSPHLPLPAFSIRVGES